MLNPHLQKVLQVCCRQNSYAKWLSALVGVLVWSNIGMFAFLLLEPRVPRHGGRRVRLYNTS